MAHKSFLSSEDWQQAKEHLTPPLMKPDGDVRQVFCFSNDSFSAWLGQRLEEKIKAFPDWQKTHPITLGSWARGELCPKSDIDMLFCGDEHKVKELSDHLLEQGFKLRYRMPQNPEDWTQNVEIFDILALLKARPWTSEAAKKLHSQQKAIWSQKLKLRRQILKVVREERMSRADRYDSITNYLEPHLKFGPGGLRDLEQGLQIYELFAEKFNNPGHALNVLQYYRSFFLSIRQKLHIEGQNDTLSSSHQFDLAKWMGFSSHKDFMREIERGLSRVHFYSDWIVDVAGASDQDLKSLDKLNLKKPQDLYQALKKNPRLLMQKKVRENMDQAFAALKPATLNRAKKEIFESLLDVKTEDKTLVSVFRSRLIDKLSPEIQRLFGYVQHDQYHRFTADSHIMQACREVKRVYKKSAELAALKEFHKKLKPFDWQVISWTCLYHDLAKGLGAGEHHGDLGTQFVERDFKNFGFSKAFTDEVKWMVHNHLELSSAAFRKNPRDPALWQELREKGLVGSRLYRLAIFTAIDIRATNPEAWNEWKAKLLRDLCYSLESQKAQDYFQFQKLARKKSLNFSVEQLEALSPVLLESLGVEKLVQDLCVVVKGKDIAPKLFKMGRKEMWVRFYNPEDRAGLLSEYVQQLFSLGLGVRHAAIHTLPKLGVYDWFQLSTQKSQKQIELLLTQAISLKKLPEVQFESIELVSSSREEWVLLFKGLDQSGLLAAAAKSLSEEGLSIQSARVHTWGRKVEDVFVLKPKSDLNPQVLVDRLSSTLRTQNGKAWY